MDGAKPQVLRDMMELEIVHKEEHDEAPAKVYEAAGGYLPTLGILGAVLGLAGIVLPALPGTLFVLAGIVLGAWIDDFTRVGWIAVTAVAVLAVLAWVMAS